MVADLKENVKQLREDLLEANSRTATLESNVLRQQMANNTGSDKRKVRLSLLALIEWGTSSFLVVNVTEMRVTEIAVLFFKSTRPWPWEKKVVNNNFLSQYCRIWNMLVRTIRTGLQSPSLPPIEISYQSLLDLTRTKQQHPT